MRNPIILALDVPDLRSARKLIRELAPVVGAFKLGKELFVAHRAGAGARDSGDRRQRVFFKRRDHGCSEKLHQ